MEQAVEQHEDQQQAERYDQREPLLRLDQRAEFAGPVEFVTRRQRHLVGNALLRFGDRRAEVAPAHAVFERYKTLAVLAVDIGGAGLQLHLAEVAERDIGGRRFRIVARKRDRDGADGVGIAAIFGRKANGKREVELTLV